MKIYVAKINHEVYYEYEYHEEEKNIHVGFDFDIAKHTIKNHPDYKKFGGAIEIWEDGTLIDDIDIWGNR